MKKVRGLLTTLKKIFFWNYARNTWQWDILCVVILVFIFLTPKSWFSGGERPVKVEHQNPIAKTLVLSPEVVDNEEDKSKIEQHVRLLTGRSETQVLAVRKMVGSDGKTLSYEVDIR
ncbi:MAG TPA: hypothetical protein VFH91_00420 [Pyrinomonadaceae bacterium]|nr:hypothetical protein [Pyrinomonadaceae bacterium]